MIVRPATEADVPAFFDVTGEAFEDYARRYNEPVRPRPDYGVSSVRWRHLIVNDPGGAWVAESDGELIAGGLALLREGVWGLSLLVTHPAHQSTGAGRAVLDACHSYAEGARGRIILASIDPRALRSYARLGLKADPSLTAVGMPGDVAMPEGVRDGDASDMPFLDEVSRFVRGAAHGSDIEAMLAAEQPLLVSERGYVLFRDDGEIRLLAAYDERAAAELLRAAFSRLDKATVAWLTASQQWAIRTCLDAGLRLKVNQGAVFTDGDVGPFTPYIPSGAYL